MQRVRKPEPEKQQPKTGARSNGFKKGRQKTGGAKKGTRHQITNKVREAAILGAAACGFDKKGEGGLVGWMHRLAIQNPVALAQMLTRFVPLQLDGKITHEDGSGRYETREALLLEFERRGLPAPPRLIDITPAKEEVD